MPQHLRRLLPLERTAPARVRREGRDLIDFSANDYLGLALHPLLRERAAAWALDYGAGAAASRLVSGSLTLHHRVEEKLAALKNRERALFFASGWQANVGVLAALIGRGDLVFADRLVHASLHQGVKAAGAREIRYRHNDLAHLEELLAGAASRPGKRFIVTESVFSMDGDRADVTAIGTLAARFGAFFYLDEAHATGVLGPRGRGLANGAVDLAMGTFSKALGGFGAYVAGSEALIHDLIQRCSGFIHTTAPPPAVLGAADAALDLVPAMDAERAHLAELSGRLRRGLAALDLPATGLPAFAPGTSGDTQIVPLLVGDAGRALRLAARLEAAGFLAVAIRPPTVPEGTSRLRFTLSAAHRSADVDALLGALEQAVRPA